MPVRDTSSLVAFIDARARTPFAWGRGGHDCVSFALGGVQAATGRDPLKPLGVDWTTARGAARVLKRLGGLEAAVDRVLVRVPAGMARRGDVALAEAEGRQCLMLVEGATLVGPGLNGLVRAPRRVATLFWSIDL